MMVGCFMICLLLRVEADLFQLDKVEKGKEKSSPLWMFRNNVQMDIGLFLKGGGGQNRLQIGCVI